MDEFENIDDIFGLSDIFDSGIDNLFENSEMPIVSKSLVVKITTKKRPENPNIGHSKTNRRLIPVVDMIKLPADTKVIPILDKYWTSNAYIELQISNEHFFTNSVKLYTLVNPDKEYKGKQLANQKFVKWRDYKTKETVNGTCLHLFKGKNEYAKGKPRVKLHLVKKLDDWYVYECSLVPDYEISAKKSKKK